MKTLLLIRHAHAKSNNPAWSDHERPLSDRGIQLAKTTASLLVDDPPDQILCSSATRTQQTAGILADTLGTDVVPKPIDDLYLAPAAKYIAVAARELRPDDNCVWMVGHNPGIAMLISEWARQSLSISPGSVAIFRVNVDDWSSLAAKSDVVPELTGFLTGGVRVS